MSHSERDEDTAAFFKEIENEEKRNFATCNAGQAFDAFWQCYTLGSQAIHYYRYGEKKDCSGKWDDFKFCLKTKPKSSQVADAMIRQREKEKEQAKRQMRNSEDVWEARQ